MQENYYLFFFLALLAEILGTMSGFGSSILFVPLASMFLDFKLVLGITAVFHVFSNLSKIYLFQSGIDKKIALKLGIPAVIAVIIGAILTYYIPQKQTELGMNVLVFCLAIYLLGGGHKKIKQSDSNLYIGGGIFRFFSGINWHRRRNSRFDLVGFSIAQGHFHRHLGPHRYGGGYVQSYYLCGQWLLYEGIHRVYSFPHWN